MRVSLLVLLLGIAPIAAGAADSPQIVDEAYPSAALTAFWGTPIAIHADVLLPDGYYDDPARRYPVIYVVPAFGEDYRFDATGLRRWKGAMRALHAPFIVVKLEGMVRMFGEPMHHEFADSANDGPWGTALTTEAIPAIDAGFRTIPQARARFLFGHSSGGWSVLWLQVNYPKLFGGAWALAPDPVDFHCFTGPDLTRNPPQNFYADGVSEYPMYRRHDRDTETLRDLVGTFNEQFDSFEDVFSPRALNGYPARLFDRHTGVIDASVAAYWEAHYDITHLIATRWATLAPLLRGKLHVFVGTDDTYHLDAPVHLMDAEMAKLGAGEEFGYAVGYDHWQIYSWHGGLVRYSTGEMQASLQSPPPDGTAAAAEPASP